MLVVLASFLVRHQTAEHIIISMLQYSIFAILVTGCKITVAEQLRFYTYVGRRLLPAERERGAEAEQIIWGCFSTSLTWRLPHTALHNLC